MFFYSTTNAQVSCLKNNFKIYIKINIKTAPTYFGVTVTPSSGKVLHVQARITRSLMMVWLHRNMSEMF